jgi:hypothetical protein
LPIAVRRFFSFPFVIFHFLSVELLMDLHHRNQCKQFIPEMKCFFKWGVGEWWSFEYMVRVLANYLEKVSYVNIKWLYCFFSD